MIERFAGRFVLLRPLGQGGMGKVFLARDTTTGAECALKRLDRRAVSELPQAVRREFEALTRVRHPAVVSVHELGVSPEGIPYYTMEYVPGRPADQVVARHDWAAGFFVGARVAHGLEVLHSAGVIHGDLKPSNLLVVPGEPGTLPRAVRLVDFGLAGLVGRDEAGHTGTAGFAAPEVVRGQPPSPASDLYGLGATLYTVLAGRRPFEGDHADAILRHQQAGPPSALPLEESGAPAGLVQLVLRLMAHEPGERPRDAREVRRELERLHPAARRPLAERLQTVVVVGRQRELARLESWWRRAPARPRLMILQGEPGAGKSALLAELAARTQLAEGRVVHLSCGAMEGPGSTAAAVLRRLAAEAGADPAGEIASVSGKAALTSGFLRDEDLDALAAVASRWAETIAPGTAPLLVLLDDAERLDALSRAWIRRLVTRPETTPVLFAWAHRPATEGTPQDESLLIETGLAERIEVGPLDRAAVEQVAAARLGEVPPAPLVEFLWARCGGHAGLTVELLTRSATDGSVTEDEAGLRVDEAALASLGIPPDYESSLMSRFEALSAETRRLAEALAVWEAGLDEDGARLLVPGWSEAATERLVGSGLARRTEAGDLMLWPPVLAERIGCSLDPERRRSLHRAALSRPGLTHAQRFRHLSGAGNPAAALEEARLALEEAPDDALAARAAELADRQVPARAAEWHERAAGLLMRRRLYTAAAPHLERALELERNGDARAARLAALVRSYVRIGRFADVARIVEEATREPLPPAIRARLLADDATRLHLTGVLEAARARANEALAAAEQANDPEAEGAAATVLGYLDVFDRRLDEGEEMARRAGGALERAGNDLDMRGRGLRIYLERARHRLDEAIQIAQEELRVARERGDRLHQEELQYILGAILAEAGLWDQAWSAYQETARLAVEDAHPAGVTIGVMGLAILAGLTGRPRTARRYARRAIRLSRAHRPRSESAAWRALAQGYRISGSLRRSERAARRAVALAGKSDRGEVCLCLLELGRALSASGRWKEAAEIAESGLAVNSDEMTLQTAFLTILSALAALHDRQLASAEECLAALRRWLGTNPRLYAEAQALVLEAEIAFRRGRSAEGFEVGQRALDAFGRLPAPPDRAVAALELARHAPVTPDPASRVVQWLDLAAATFERLGDRRNRAAALTMLVDWLRRSEGSVAPATDERNLIEQVSWLLNSLTDLPELIQRAMRLAVEQLGAERGLLLLLDRETGQFEAMAEHGGVDAATRDEALKFSRKAVERVAESGGSLVISDVSTDPQASDSMRKLRLQSILCVPLFLGGVVVGAVYLDNSRRTHQFGPAERGLLEGFAHLLAVAIEQARGHEEIERLKVLLEGENLSLRQEVGTRFQFQNLIGTSNAMRRIQALVEHAMRVDTTVLITGENGSGKELVARTLHHGGRRRLGPFVPVNCGAIPETLLESELFGILANVATGVRARDGKFVQASSGTLFLDEIGEMPLHQQVALLSAISSREITPVGGAKPIPVDVRIVAATNSDPRQRIAQGKFREDLFYRLSVIEIEMPPLRDRKSDIPALAQHFLETFARAQEREVPKLSPDFMAVLMQSDWPGNVRALQNYIERVLAMNPGPVLRPNPLPHDVKERSSLPKLPRGRGLIPTLEEIERKLVREALDRARGNQSQAARELGLPEQSLRYRMHKYGLSSPRNNRRPRKK